MVLRPKFLSLIAAATLAPSFVLAQTPEAAPAAPAATAAPAPAAPVAEEKKAVVEEITVTGTRVRRKDLNTPAPVTVLSREQVIASGKISIGDFLQALPEQGNAINAAVNNGGEGSTRVDLRSLGSNRTLVLVNGRRMVPGGTGADTSVDLNSIPTAAVERIEILKDGASAIYGSDAISGVVNIITRRTFEGIEANVLGGTTSKSDGTTWDMNVTAGTSSERGNVLLSLGYFTMKPVFAGDRSWTSTIYGFDYGFGRYFTGSSAVPMGRFRLNPASCSTAACVALQNAGFTAATNFIVDPSATATAGFRAYRAPNPFTGSLGDAYNFEPDNYLFTPQQRISLYSAGDTSLGGFARAFFEASYVNRQSDQQLAPEPLFTTNNGVVVSKDSLYNPFGVDVADVRRRLVEFGPRRFNQDLDSFRLVAGLDGSLPEIFGPVKGWVWETSLNFGRTTGITATNGTLRAPRIQDAIGPSRLVNGVPTCLRDVNDPSSAVAGCVPLNLFGGAGSITPDQVAGLGFFGADNGYNQMGAYQLNLSGELFRLLSDRPVGLAVGYEYRRMLGAQYYNPISASGENTGNNSQSVKGSYDVHEGYAELSLPVVSNMDFVEDLEFSAAFRAFKYSTFGSDNTYKIGGKWRPVRDFTLRGTYSTAFRAPSISELYSGLLDNFPSVSDPCGSTGGDAALDALCQSQGVPAGGNGDDRTQLKEKQGGNVNLKPETAKIFTVGLVFEPRWVRNLSFTVDYFSIDLKDSISVLGAGVILNGCYPSGNPVYCSLIRRTGAASGAVVDFLDDANTNVGGTKVQGLDVAARYNLPTPYGRFNFVVDSSFLFKYDDTLADGTVNKVRGTFTEPPPGLYGALPNYKLNAGVMWAMKGFGAGLTGKYIPTIKECGDRGQSLISNNPAGAGSGICSTDATSARVIDRYVAFDGFVSYTLPSSFGKSTLAAGMNNILDRDPPVQYSDGTYQGDPRTYDSMGRFFYFRVSHAY